MLVKLATKNVTEVPQINVLVKFERLRAPMRVNDLLAKRLVILQTIAVFADQGACEPIDRLPQGTEPR